MKNEPIRIAHIIGKWLGGGVESVVMNYYRHIDRSKIQFDFICDEDSTNIPYEEIESLGGKVILIPPYQKVFKYHKELKKVLKNEKYKIVHSHINTLSVFPLFAAKCAKVPIRIAHSHSTTNPKEKKKNLLKIVLRPFTKLFSNKYMSCTEHAGRWLFGNKTFEKNNVYVLNNAIELDKFSFDLNDRIKLRKEFNIEDDEYVIGHIGRFVEQKNHRFIIDIFNEVHKMNNKTKLMLVGQGPLVQEIKDRVSSYNLDKFVIFAGQRNNVQKMYQAFDVFLFPSLYEGLGMVLIEAQASNLACITSTEVPTIAKATDNFSFLSLNDDLKRWADEVIYFITKHIKRKKVTDDRLECYNINNEVIKLEKEYLKYLKEVGDYDEN